jgi:hypothetical protein
VIDTFAPAIDAPEGSVTVPESVAPVTCADAWLVERIAMAKMTNTGKVAVTLRKKARSI